MTSSGVRADPRHDGCASAALGPLGVARVRTSVVMSIAVGVAVGVVVGVGLSLLTGCSAHDASGRDELRIGTTPAHVSVQARRVAGLGTVLTDGAGHTLYMFPPDAGSRVSCTGPCAGTWPPLSTTSMRPVAGTGVNAAVLATLPDPNSGAYIVTYAGYPLYRYSGDISAGTANGQALFLDGGPWYTLTPAGNPVTITPVATTSGQPR